VDTSIPLAGKHPLKQQIGVLWPGVDMDPWDAWSQPVPSSPFLMEARGPVWRHSMLGMVVLEAKRLACWHSRDSWQKDSGKERPLASTANIIVQRTYTILKDKWKLSYSFLSQSTYWQIFKTILWWTLQGFQKSGTACLCKCDAKLCTNTETDRQIAEE